MAVSASKRLLLALVAGLALGACGAGTSEATKSYDSVSALAKDLGCSGVTVSKGAHRVKEEGHCTLDGERVTVKILPAGVDPEPPAPFGGSWEVLGKNWTVETPTAAGAKKVQAKLGGTIQ